MRGKILVAAALAALLVPALSGESLPGRETSPGMTRERAQQLFGEGNYGEAFVIYEKLVLDPRSNLLLVGADLEQAVACLQSLNRVSETDLLREGAVKSHPGNWRLLWRAAESYFSASHYGYIVAGEFRRGQHRGGGRYVNSFERDRVRALQLMEEGRGMLKDEPVAAALAEFYLRYAAMLMGYRGYGGAWRMQYLTALSELPDLEDGYGYYGSGDARAAPVGPDGEPVLHHVPASWEGAVSDGERWRWMLRRAGAVNPAVSSRVSWELASFLHQQFGVQTMSSYGAWLRSGGTGDSGETREGAWSLHTLGEDETIARLATGARRFRLPEEFAFIRILRDLADDPGGGYGEAALDRLAQVFENRRQYGKAAGMWRQSLEGHGDSGGGRKRRRIDQITGNWGDFEPVMTHPAGQGATVEYRYRNGRRVSFEAHEIKVKDLLEDVKRYLRSNPRQLEGERVDISRIGYRLVKDNESRYLGRRSAGWDLDLDPLPGHFDRRVTVSTPLQRAGAYLLTATMEGGNTSRIVMWVSDTVIARKRLDGEDWFFVADSVSGEPIPGMTVEFFGYDQERTDWQKIVGRRYNVNTTAFSYRTDGDGQVTPNPRDFNNTFRWLITAAGEGRLAYLGWSGVWHGRRHDTEYNERKTYLITDRPVYRPDQEVRFKLWVRHARYDQENASTFADRSFTVRIDNPMNEKVYEQSFRADRWGGVDGGYVLPADAALGAYRIFIPGYGGGSFRVEEYKKPEFEVTVEGPAEPVMLGEKMTVRVEAKYYFGAPVAEATVKYKVLRTPHEARWYPVGPWDWFYGPGYGWFAPDYPWYPRWEQWGIERPAAWWWPTRAVPPEVVAEAEAPIGADGGVSVEIDTSFAKEIHGDTDHRYEIVAEVTDRSRRTIVGRGSVLVARRPFKVYAWVDRGHYRAGEVVRAGFSAQTVDGKPVRGSGVVDLYRVTYDNGEPVETSVRRWDLDMDDEGKAVLQLKASEAGQYRLSCRLTDTEGHTVEGGYLFVVRGRGFDGKEFRFNAIEIVPEKREYAPGESVRLMINTDRPGGTVVLFLRPADGVYLKPRVIRLAGKSTVARVAVTKKDMPNFFVEAFTVSGGRVYSETREIAVPPEKRVLNVEVLPSAARYRPGERASVKVRVTDFLGVPFSGSLVMSVYDKAVEYVSGGSNVPEIRGFFWKWRRRHQPRTETSLDRRFGSILISGETGMQPLGVFGHLVADESEQSFFGGGDGRSRGELKQMKAAAPAAAMSSAPMREGAVGRGMALTEADAVGGALLDGREGKPAEVKPTVRKEFADTAFWAASLVTDGEGTAEIEFDMPDNLTGWKIRTWALGHGTVVGEGTAEAVTAKNLILRLQAPRFFVEKDEAILSANVHNYLEEGKSVRAVLELDGGSLALMGAKEQVVYVPSGGETRVDWRVRVLRQGEAVVRMQGLTDEESDAMQMSFPVYVHGMQKTESVSGVVRRDEGSQSFTFTVPAERRLDQSRLEIRYSPTLAGAMVDALPYLAEYPYGCTEQTLNRFLPTVITQKILLEMGLDLEEVRRKRANLNAQELGDSGERAKQWKRWGRNPVFDEETVRDMVRQGVKRLAAMQLSDGGWGWFSGWGERSTPHTTATVVRGLQVAEGNGAVLTPGMLEGGVRWLGEYQAGELTKLQNADGPTDPWKRRADNLDAFVHMVLVSAGKRNGAMRDFLYRDRTHLSVYALAMFGMALHSEERTDELEMVMRNLGQYVVEDSENQTAYLDLPGENWWYWYGSEYEAHAYYLKLLAATEPQSTRAAGLVKYLLNNRKHATWWNSTRDTALSIEAMADYLRASGEDRPEMTVEIFLDGQRKKSVRISRENLFGFDNALVLEGEAVAAGEHTVEVRRKGTGPVYFNAYLSNFTLEDFIGKAGLEIRVERRYYRLDPAQKSVKISGARGQVVDQRVEKYRRTRLENMDMVSSGDLVEIELEIESKNDYEYLVFEDMKAAGFEPVEVRSGYGGNDMGAYMELRDERVVFFVRALARGKHSLAFRMRAETPGIFSALPTRAHAMYAPELKANSDEIKLRVEDRNPPDTMSR